MEGDKGTAQGERVRNNKEQRQKPAKKRRERGKGTAQSKCTTVRDDKEQRQEAS